MPNDKKDVMVGASHYLSTQVETANIQLSIALQLSVNIEQKRFVEVLKNIDKKSAIEFISRNLYLNESLIEQYKDKWEWDSEWESGLSGNESLPWSLEV